MTPGTLLFDSEFKFNDGEEAKKILVVLGTSKGVTVMAKTTSNGIRYALDFGCQAKNRFPCFHLSKNSCCLDKPTWICLHEFYEFRDSLLLQRHFSGKINRIGELPEEITEMLLECALTCDDVTVSQSVIITAARAGMG